MDDTNLPGLIEHIDHFQRRVIQEALDDASSLYWRRRADAFEWARPQPGDFPGRATPEQRRERDRRLAEMAENCRRRASVSVWEGR